MIREGIESGIKGKHRSVKLCQVWSWDNLVAAEKEAHKGKGHSYGVKRFNEMGVEKGLREIQRMLSDGSFKSSAPTIAIVHCPSGKMREITKVPYYPDHIVHHALMRVLLPSMVRSYYQDSFASIKGRGIHKALYRVRKWVDLHKELYFAKTDFKKFYANIDQEKCYLALCRMYHDEGIRRLLKEILTVREKGLGIGLYPVQAIANFYLNELDRRIGKHGAHIFRYCDDILVTGETKKAVWDAVNEIRRCADDIGLSVHDGVDLDRVTEETAIDFVGYRVFSNRTFIRNRMKKRMKRSGRPEQLVSYRGWLIHCDGRMLWDKIKGMKKFSELNIRRRDTDEKGRRFFDVPLVKCEFLKDRVLVIKDFQDDVETCNGKGRYAVLCEEGGRECKFLTNNPRMKDVLDQCRELGGFPFECVLRCRNLGGSKIDYYFE